MIEKTFTQRARSKTPRPRSIPCGLILFLCGCHSSQPAATSSRAANLATQPAPSPAALPSTPATSSVPPATAKLSKRDQELEAQLNLDLEGGTRGAGFPLTVHVLHDGKPVPKALVGAAGSTNQLEDKQSTNAHGDTQLILGPATYRVVAKRGPLHAEQTIHFRGAQTCTLILQ